MLTHFYANKARKYIHIIPPNTSYFYGKIKIPKDKSQDFVKVLRQWKNDLREGFFRKGKYQLITISCDGVETRCVLGVLLSQLSEVEEYYFDAAKIHSDDFKKIFHFHFAGIEVFQQFFMHLNDVYNLSFLEIAEFIEKFEKYLLNDEQKHFYYLFETPMT